MKETILNKVEAVRQLGIFAIVCFGIVSWVGARACLAIFQEAIYHSLREWLLLGNRPARTRLGACALTWPSKQLPESNPTGFKPGKGSRVSSFGFGSAICQAPAACERAIPRACATNLPYCAAITVRVGNNSSAPGEEFSSLRNRTETSRC